MKILDIADNVCSIWLDDFAEWIVSTDNQKREFELFREGCCVYNRLPDQVTKALDHVHMYGAENHIYDYLRACVLEYELLPSCMKTILDKYASEAAHAVYDGDYDDLSSLVYEMKIKGDLV